MWSVRHRCSAENRCLSKQFLVNQLACTVEHYAFTLWRGTLQWSGIQRDCYNFIQNFIVIILIGDKSRSHFYFSSIIVASCKRSVQRCSLSDLWRCGHYLLSGANYIVDCLVDRYTVHVRRCMVKVMLLLLDTWKMCNVMWKSNKLVNYMCSDYDWKKTPASAAASGWVAREATGFAASLEWWWATA